MASRDSVYESILNQKRAWDQAHASGNQAGQTSAHQGAIQYYNMLDANERSAIQGMNTQQLDDYRQQMLQHNQNMQQQQQQPPSFNPPVQQIDFDQYRTQNATIEDLMKQFNFDYSRDYAAQQAEAEAQSRRDAIANQQRGVDSRLEGTADSLDRNYFLQGLQQSQNQTNRGLNAGIAADQNLRMAMSRQAAMGDMYRDANVEHMRLADDLGRVDLERLAREDSLFNERLQQGFQNSLALTESDRMNNQQMLDFLLNQRGQDIDQYQFGEDYQLREGALTGNYMNSQVRSLLDDHIRLKDQTEANWLMMSPAEQRIAREQGDEQRRQLALLGINVGDDLNAAQVQQMMASGQIGQSTIDRQQMTQQQQQFEESMKWEREQFNNLSKAQQEQFAISKSQLEEQKRQFNSEQEWREHTFANMSATDRARLNADIQQFGVNDGWRRYEFNETMRYNEARLEMEAGYQGNFP